MANSANCSHRKGSYSNGPYEDGRDQNCPDCSPEFAHLNRRHFIKAAGATALAATAFPGQLLGSPEAKPPQSEQLVKQLFESLTAQQRGEVCFPWDYNDDRGLLRTHVSNNWSITDRKKLNVGGDFFTKDQQDLIEALFFNLYNPEWHDRIRIQLKDDAGGYGKEQTIAIFGEPGTEQFEFVMTGRHLTIRCDGNTSDHVAFGGPIFYGHAAKGFNEAPDHPGNVFWPQAQKANALYEMLDGKQRKVALIEKSPRESAVGLQGADAKLPGLAASELSSDQKAHLQSVLQFLLEPYRLSDREEAIACLERGGGLEKCHLSFYRDSDLGSDGIWDNWRLEGPSFVWYFRGKPHVHVWVNVAGRTDIPLNARG